MGYRLFNIPFYEDGLFLLSDYLQGTHQDDLFAMSQTTVLLPTRRACRRLQSLLLEKSPSITTVMPRVLALGDLGQAFFQQKPFLSSDEALGKVLRVLIQQEKLTLAEALPLAKAFLELEKEGSLCQVNWQQDLKTLFPDELAKHRQTSLRHLDKLVSSLKDDLPQFPGALQAKALKTYLTNCFSDQGTGSADASCKPVYAYGLFPKNALEQEFLYALSQYPKSMIWLSGLDRLGSDKEFKTMKSPHPQAFHASFLTKLNLKRHDIPDWPFCSKNRGESVQDDKSSFTLLKQNFIHKVFQETFGEKKPASEKLGFSIATCQTSQEEARLIALALRQVVESSTQKALFVTSDTSLARLVMEELKRYDLYPDTGSGYPFAWTEAGSFLSLILDAVMTVDEFSNLCLFKHPLFRLGEKAQDVRSKARLYERLRLRSIPAEPFTQDLDNFLEKVNKSTALFTNIFQDRKSLYRPADLFQAHLQVSELLSKDERGHPLIWSKEVGNLAFETCSALLKTLSHFPSIKISDYNGLIRSLLKAQTIRQSHSVHPQLLILDPDQASLQKADLLILGGMTEGSWPKRSRHDPWLSSDMKQALAMTTEAGQRSLESHLFAEFLESFPNMLITVPERTCEGPQKTSPFLKRLETAAKSEGISLAPPHPWQQWSKELVTVTEPKPQSRPKPSPMLNQRPRRLSVTDVETLRRNPYLFYLQKILKIRPFPDLNVEPDPALFGTFLHEVLESFLSQKDHSLEKLLALGKEKISPFNQELSVKYFWQTRFESCAQWFLDEQEKLGPPQNYFLEWTGSLKRTLPWMGSQDGSETLTLSGKADRLDQREDGSISIIDYKSGSLPSRKSITEGDSVQLALEALILREGGFKNLPASSNLNCLDYWHFKEPYKRVTYVDNLEILVDQADRLLDSLMITYYKEGAPFTASHDMNCGHVYDPLIRTQEWLSNVA